MKLAIDPYMFRHLPIGQMVRTVADIGYEYIELSPREDFMPFFLHPRADRARVAELKTALRESGVQLSSLLPLYRWSGPDEGERQAAVRYWKRAIEIAVELDCAVMNSELNGRPERAAESEAQFWRSMETLLPIFERFRANSEGVDIWRGESSSASHGLATRAARAQSRRYRVADSAVVRKNQPRFFRRNLDDRLHRHGSALAFTCQQRDLAFAIASHQTGN